MYITICLLTFFFCAFQTADDSRKLLKYLDPELGKPLPEQSYAEDCRIYDPDPNHPGGHFHNLWVGMREGMGGGVQSNHM